MKNYKIQDAILLLKSVTCIFHFSLFHFSFCLVHFTKILYFIIFSKRKRKNMLLSQKKTVTLQSQKQK